MVNKTRLHWARLNQLAGSTTAGKPGSQSAGIEADSALSKDIKNVLSETSLGRSALGIITFARRRHAHLKSNRGVELVGNVQSDHPTCKDPRFSPLDFALELF